MLTIIKQNPSNAIIKKKPSNAEKAVTFPPFVHSRDSLSKWWLDLIIAYLPVFIFLVAIDNTRWIVFFLSLAVFLLSGFVLKRAVLKYLLWSIIFTVLVSPEESLILIVAVTFAAIIIEELIFDWGARAVIPGFLIAWILIQSTSVQYPPLILIASGGVYLFLRRRLPLLTLSGAALTSVLFLNISNTSMDKLPLLGMIILLIGSYPGIVPLGKFKRFIFGVISGVVVLKFGLWGWSALLLLVPLIEEF